MEPSSATAGVALSSATASFPPSLHWCQAEHVRGSETLGWKVSVSLVLILSSSQSLRCRSGLVNVSRLSRLVLKGRPLTAGRL